MGQRVLSPEQQKYDIIMLTDLSSQTLVLGHEKYSFFSIRIQVYIILYVLNQKKNIYFDFY